MQFLRALSEGLKVSHGVPCEWTGSTKGCLYIPRMGWAVELLHEGDRASLGKHIGRFTHKDGQYKQWICDGSIKEWLVVDCRTSRSASENTCG